MYYLCIILGAISFPCSDAADSRRALTDMRKYVYSVDDKSIAKHIDGSKSCSFDCNNEDSNCTEIMSLNSKSSINKVIFLNCNFSSFLLYKVLEKLNVSTETLVLNNWNPMEVNRFSSLEGLTALEISKANIIMLEDKAFEDLINLTQLHITNCNLSIQQSIELPPKLKLLNISNNGLASLPKDLIQRLKDLAVLILRGNKIHTLDTNFFDNSPIRVLDVSYNQISDIPDGLFLPLNSLSELYLEGNLLQEIRQTTFENLKKLETLNLSHNSLQVLPENVFSSLSKLQILELSHNQLWNIETDVFPGPFSAVTTLDLSYNNLTDLCSNGNSVLYALTNLQQLYLQHNFITMTCTVGKSLSNLRHLNFSHNQLCNITYLDLYFISNKPLVADYSHNNITSIIFEKANYEEANKYESRKFLIEDNPILCDSYMYWFVRAARENKLFKTTIDDVACVAPEVVRNMKLSTVPLTELTFESDCIYEQLDDCKCSYYEVDSEFTINCSSIPSPDVASFDTPEDISSVVLIIENCNLTSLPLSLPKRITKVHGAHNAISAMPDLPSSLKYLDLSYNNITSLPPARVEGLFNITNSTLKLSHNPLRCSCDSMGFLTSVVAYQQQVLDYDTVRCADDVLVSAVAVLSLCRLDARLVVGLCVAAVLMVMFSIACPLYYKYRYEIMVILYTRGWLPASMLEQELDKDKQYDAFVSYAHGDEDFVLDELLPTLESEPHHFKLCVHHRDWLVGPNIVLQILNSVEDSRRTLILLSKKYLNSIWAKAEFRAATDQALRTANRVIVIVLDDLEDTDITDPELRSYLATYTHLRRTEPLFWEKLCYMLPHRRFAYKPKFIEPLSRGEEKKREKKLRPIIDFVDRCFAERELNNQNGAVNAAVPRDGDSVDNNITVHVSNGIELKGVEGKCNEINL